MKRIVLTILAIGFLLACSAQSPRTFKNGVKIEGSSEISTLSAADRLFALNSEKIGVEISLANLVSQLNIASGNLTQEEVEDILGAALENGTHTNATFVYNDNGAGVGTISATINGQVTLDPTITDGSTNGVENNAIFDRFVQVVDEAANSPEQLTFWKGTKAQLYAIYGQPATGLPNEVVFFVTDSIIPSSSGGFADGDYEDIIVGNSGTQFLIKDGVVNSAAITDDGINGFTDIQDGSITVSEMQDNSISKSKMQDNSVGIDEIDDTFYLTGAFTPTLVDLTGGATYTFTITSAEYLKIGEFMYFEVYLSSINTTGTPTGTFRMGGFPYTFDGQPVFAVRTSGSSEDFESIIAIGVSNQLSFTTSKSISTGDNANVYDDITYSNGNLRVSGFSKIQ